LQIINFYDKINTKNTKKSKKDINMINSMTGFGHFEGESGGFHVIGEIRSVNHRFLECSAKIPRIYGFLEEKIKSFIAQNMTRGKIEIYISLEPLPDCNTAAVQVCVNENLAREYGKAFERIAFLTGARGTSRINGEICPAVYDAFTASDIARMPDVLTAEKPETDEKLVWETTKFALENCLKQFLEMRKREGEKLRDDILNRADIIKKHINKIEKRFPELKTEFREKLEARMRELLENVTFDEQRLLTETAIMADKTDVSEEIVRLNSHLEQLELFMNENAPTGRKLDFLVQEINREANTIGSKIQNLEIARVVVEIKSEIEKIREQVQNIE